MHELTNVMSLFSRVVFTSHQSLPAPVMRVCVGEVVLYCITVETLCLAREKLFCGSVWYGEESPVQSSQ